MKSKKTASKKRKSTEINDCSESAEVNAEQYIATRQNNATAWDNNFAKLYQFSLENGHCHVPYKENRPLAKWATRQRSAKSLTSLKVDLLNSIGYDWTCNNQFQERLWERHYSALKDFCAKNNHAAVPQIYPPDKGLGVWVANQRKLNGRGNLKKERKDKLEKIGFIWSMKKVSTKRAPQSNKKYDDMWHKMFNCLKEYKKKYGDCNVPYNFKDNSGSNSLALWVSTQRREYGQKSWYGTQRQIRHNRKELLDNVGFSWSVLLKKKSNPKDSASEEDTRLFEV